MKQYGSPGCTATLPGAAGCPVAGAPPLRAPCAVETPRYPEHPSHSERAREGAGNEAGHSCPIPGITPRLPSPIWGLLCSFLTAQRGLVPAFACVLVRKRPLYALFGREGGEPEGSREGGMAHPSVGVEYGCRLEVRSVVRTVT